jgi:hypothetical protein
MQSRMAEIIQERVPDAPTPPVQDAPEPRSAAGPPCSG